MKKIPPIPLWLRFKAWFLGRRLLLVSKDEENYEFRTMKRQHDELAWGDPNQVYIDDKGKRYANEYYMVHAILQNSSRSPTK